MRKHIPAHFRDPLENEVIERRRIMGEMAEKEQLTNFIGQY